MKHKWHKEIKAWASGAEIEYFDELQIRWLDVLGMPRWDSSSEYRIKPTFEQEYIRKMAEKALSIPEISKAVDRVFEAFREPQPKEPQYLYVYQTKGEGLELGYAPHDGINLYNTRIVGKIKLEADDDTSGT